MKPIHPVKAFAAMMLAAGVTGFAWYHVGLELGAAGVIIPEPVAHVCEPCAERHTKRCPREHVDAPRFEPGVIR